MTAILVATEEFAWIPEMMEHSLEAGVPLDFISTHVYPNNFYDHPEYMDAHGDEWPWPFGYKGLGDPAVFLFFGVIAVVGTTYVQTLVVSAQALLASLSVGALATAILVVNNVRDIDTDRSAGKRTLAVRLGRDGARAEYAGLLLLAYGMLPVFWLACDRSVLVFLPLATLPRALSLLRVVRTDTAGPPLNAALAGTAQLTLIFSLLLALGWLA